MGGKDGQKQLRLLSARLGRGGSALFKQLNVLITIKLLSCFITIVEIITAIIISDNLDILQERYHEDRCKKKRTNKNWNSENNLQKQS